MIRERLRAFFSRGAEATVAVVLVLAFFLVFIVILWYSFPKGVGLGNAIRSLESPPPSVHPVEAGHAEERWEQRVAKLSNVKRNVKSKLAASIVWSAANEGLELGEHDAVQTLAQSGASIVFEKNQEISLGENSLIVIRRFEKDAQSDARRVSVVLLGGVLEGSVGTRPGGATAVEIVAGKSSASIASPAGGTTKFRVAAATDDASAISVVSGRADVRVGDRTVSVGAGQAVTVSPQGLIQGPKTISKAPVLVSPDKGAVIRSRVLPMNVALAWSDEVPGRTYRVEIARDASFREPVIDRSVEATAFDCQELPAGRYYWRVRAADGIAEGRVAAARSFEIETDLQPPTLRVDFPGGALEHGPVAIRGATDPNVKVYIGKEPVPVGPDGTFEASVVLRPGAQIVVVEAVDAAGNIAYASRTLAAR